MNLPDVYVPLELTAFAKRAGVSPYHLAVALGDPERFAAILETAELAALKAAVVMSPRDTSRNGTHAVRLARLLAVV